jgi:hypothetical protein
MRDLRVAVEINRAHLPPRLEPTITRSAHTNHALAALRRSRRMLQAGETHPALAQLRESLRTSRRPVVLLQACLLAGHWLRSSVRRVRNSGLG